MFTSHSLTSLGSIGHARWLTPARLDAEELLDSGAGAFNDVAVNLAEMWRLNRYLGGFRALTRHLYPRLATSQESVAIVDLGTGSAQMLVAIARWAQEWRIPIRCIGIDWAARNLAVGQSYVKEFPEITLLRADALSLPWPPESADYVISSLFLHHFPPEQLVALLRNAFACARRAIIMTDLTRGWFPWLGFKLIQPVLARNYLTRHDGALSIRRAYISSELRELACAAGLSGARVHAHWPWRMTLVADK